MTIEEAIQILENKIAVPAFFDRLATYGIRPFNREEGENLLELGVRLQKVANTIVPVGQISTEYFEKSAEDADVLLSNPTIRKAVKTIIEYQNTKN